MKYVKIVEDMVVSFILSDECSFSLSKKILIAHDNGVGFLMQVFYILYLLIALLKVYGNVFNTISHFSNASIVSSEILARLVERWPKN